MNMPEKHGPPEPEKIELPPQEIQSQVFEMFEHADKLRQESKFDEALKVFKEILLMLEKYPWLGKQKQILEEQEETIRRKNKQLNDLATQTKRTQEEAERKKQ